MDFKFQLLYRNSEDFAPRLMNMPICPNPCLLDDFIQFAQLFIPTDWRKECKIEGGKRDIKTDYTTILF